MIASCVAITIVVVALTLVATNILKSKWYIVTIYIMSLAMLYSTTLQGLTVVGSDISKELQMSMMSLRNGWDINFPDASNSSFVVSWLVPEISNLLNVAPAWIYKIILPMIFACTPVLLYLVFRKQFSVPCSAPATASHNILPSKSTGSTVSFTQSQEHHGSPKAFYAATFFMIMPVFSLEIATIGKSMVAETMMALCLWIMFSSWANWAKYTGIVTAAIIAILAHYTIGIMLIAYLIGISLILLFTKAFKSWKLRSTRAAPLRMLASVSVISIIVFVGYYSNVSQGYVTNALVKNTVIKSLTEETNSKIASLTDSISNNSPAETGEPSTSNISDSTAKSPQQPNTESKTIVEQLRITDPLVRTGIGSDFMQASTAGRLFRIIQYITQVLMLLGTVWLIFSRKMYNFRAEFLAGIFASYVLLLFCIFIPGFSSTINMTRFYHLSLFFLAPCLVLGIDIFSKQQVVERR